MKAIRAAVVLVVLAAALAGAAPAPRKMGLSMNVGESYLTDFTSTVSTAGTATAGASDVASVSKQSSVVLRAQVVFSVVAGDDASRLVKLEVTRVQASTVDVDGAAAPVNADKLDSAFASDFFFSLLPNGAVEYVTCNETDPQVEAIKKGIVATLQTQIAEHPPSGTIVTEVDAIGTHKSMFTVKHGAVSDVFEKRFGSADFAAFPDPTVSPSRFQVEGFGRVTLLRTGRYSEAVYSTRVRAFTGPAAAARASDDADPFTSQLLAFGENTLTNFRPSNTLKTYVSMEAWRAAHPGLVVEPLTVPIPTGFDVGPKQSLRVNVADGDYKYNKSVGVSKMLGGSTVGIDFNAQLFAGTNFDCSETYFNYRLFAQALSNVYLFGTSHPLLDAQFEYGRDNGAALSDAVSVSLWQKQLYSKSFPQLTDCTEHTQSIAHTDPGFSAQHTVMLAIVPVTFAASADADLQFNWGYELCDAQLLALAEAIPSVSVRVAGSADLSVLVAKAGVSLSGSMSVDLRPQVFLNGTKCLAGFDVVLDAEPINVGFSGWYQTRQCHWFSCSWGSKHEKSFWSYSAPKITGNHLFEEDLDIRSLVGK